MSKGEEKNCAKAPESIPAATALCKGKVPSVARPRMSSRRYS